MNAFSSTGTFTSEKMCTSLSTPSFRFAVPDFANTRVPAAAAMHPIKPLLETSNMIFLLFFAADPN